MWWTAVDTLATTDNRLQFAGRDVVSLAETHGTPAYLYDTEQVASQYAKLCRAIERSGLGVVESPAAREDGVGSETDLDGGFDTERHREAERSDDPDRTEGDGATRRVQIAYALKANDNSAVLETLTDCGAAVDVTSPGELRLAGEFADDRLVFTGTALSDEDLAAVAATDALVNFDSASSLARFDAEPGRAVGLRINSGVGLGRSEATKTGGSGERPVKFGIPHDDDRLLGTAFDTVADRGWTLRCLHHHVGSGWLEPAAFDREPNYFDALDNLLSVAARARDRGHPVDTVDLGGGFGVPHRASEQPFPFERFFERVTARLAASDVPISRVIIEPGTALVAPAGVFCTTVTTVERKLGRTFVGVDSGLNSFNSPAQYGYYHEAVVANRVRSDESHTVTIAGNNCEAGDLFAVDRTLDTTVREGDTLALLTAGAYGAVFRNEFNRRQPAPEVVVR